MEDFQGWQDALATRGNVQFKRYPGLSHLFMPVEGGERQLLAHTWCRVTSLKRS